MLNMFEHFTDISKTIKMPKSAESWLKFIVMNLKKSVLRFNLI